jgi:biotin operon repressor
MTNKHDNMQGLILFIHINYQSSLSAAAQLLGLSRSTVSKQLAELENKIGAIFKSLLGTTSCAKPCNTNCYSE